MDNKITQFKDLQEIKDWMGIEQKTYSMTEQSDIDDLNAQLLNLDVLDIDEYECIAEWCEFHLGVI